MKILVNKPAVSHFMVYYEISCSNLSRGQDSARASMKKVERIEVKDSNKHYIISLLKNVSKPKSLYAR